MQTTPDWVEVEVVEVETNSVLDEKVVDEVRLMVMAEEPDKNCTR